MSIMDYCRQIGVLVIFLFINGVTTQSVIDTIGPTYRAPWGTWGHTEYCAPGTYAAGYEMKIEGRQGTLLLQDDTSLNAIRLVCVSLHGGNFGTVSSAVGPFGNWGGEVMCPNNQFLKAFALQVERYQYNGDDTAANYIKFKCGRFNSAHPSTELAKSPGYGYWGTMGVWSRSCPANSAICGIKTRIEEYQHNGDDTSLNDVQFFCCSYDTLK